MIYHQIWFHKSVINFTIVFCLYLKRCVNEDVTKLRKAIVSACDNFDGQMIKNAFDGMGWFFEHANVSMLKDARFQMNKM